MKVKGVRVGLDLQVDLKVFDTGMAGLLIGEIAERTGVSAPTIRYYEEIGLLAKPSRSSAGYRKYSEATVQELRFIRKAQALGFSLDEIGAILKLSRSGQLPCSHVRSLGHQHLAAVEERIRQLQQFREELAAEVTKWDEQQTAVTCEGLCQFIAEAATPSTADTVNVTIVAERARPARGRRND